jgi:hypothetical protein
MENRSALGKFRTEDVEAFAEVINRFENFNK